jgi:putative ABC transport system permease protein
MDNDRELELRIRSAFTTENSAPEDDVIYELVEHARSAYDAGRASGCTHEEADTKVECLINEWLKDTDGLRRLSRHQPAVVPPPTSSPSALSGLSHDLLYAVRRLRRKPRYALLTIMTMALALCAATVLFSITYGVLVKPLPWPNSNRLVVLKETRGGHAPRFGSFTNATYLAWRDGMTTIEDMASYWSGSMTLTGAGEPERIQTVSATASLFHVLGVRASMGATFTEGNESRQVLLISRRLWRERFVSDPRILGRVVQLDGAPHTIVGVMEDALGFPYDKVQAWTPMHVNPAIGGSLSLFDVVAVLRPGATPAGVAAEGAARGRLAPDTGPTTTAIFGGSGPVGVSVASLRNALTGDVRQPLIILLIAVGLLCAVATANIANVQIARAISHRREIAIRAALGASISRISRQLIVENLFVGLLGGAIGLVFASLLHSILPTLLPADFPRISDLSVSLPVVLFALVASVAASVICGAAPALLATRFRITESFREGGISVVGTAKRSLWARARLVIMVLQVSLACLLLVGGSLLARSFVAQLTMDRGYDPSGVLTATIRLPEPQYAQQSRRVVVDAVLQRLMATPGCDSASFTSEMPLTAGGSTAALPMRASEGGFIMIQASPRIVSPQYFSTIGMRVVQGRGFLGSDTMMAPPVAVVNRSFARRYLNDAAVGGRLAMGAGFQDRPSVNATIVGVVDDVKYLGSTESTHPEIYYSYLQLRGGLLQQRLTLLVRTGGNPVDFAPVLRTVVRSVDSSLLPEAVSPLKEKMIPFFAKPRFYAVLLGAFALFAAAVTAVGLFGVLSYVVAQRSREFALRMALGAKRTDVVWRVFRQGVMVTAAGIGIGLLASLALTRYIAAVLYGVMPHDPVTYLIVPLLLFILSTVACCAPALRAARLNPIQLLKE